jgi:hypothetical protein
MLSKLSKKKGVQSPDRSRTGFALVTAILAIMILMALGYLALTVSTGDLRISSRIVGEKKALSATETGVHRLMEGFNPVDFSNLTVGGVPQAVGVERQADPATDPATRYTISNLGRPTAGPEMLPLAGYSIGGGQQWGQRRYTGRVTGRNTAYDSSMQIDVGMGFGPIEITTMSR